MKSIHTLVPDIQEYISQTEDWYVNARENDYNHKQRNKSKSASNISELSRSRTSLRLSKLGNKCSRQLWYSIHHPEMGERLPSSALFKYGYGHIIEELALSLARLAGHTVEGEQDELCVDGIIGHRDAVVDGCVLDVKSCSSFAFREYRDRLLEKSDPFGRLYQLDGYLLGSASDPLVLVKDKGYFFAIDKTLGHMVLYEHVLRTDTIRERIRTYRQISELSTAPSCTCCVVRDKQTGNLKLDVVASYSEYKHICFPKLRTEVISGRPIYFIQ